MRETISSLQIPFRRFTITQRCSQVNLLPLLGFWGPWFCIGAASLLLMATDHQDYDFRTISIGTITFFAFAAHLIARGAFHDPFHPDILLTMGHLAQFVVPSIIFATGIFDDVMSPGILEMRPYFPHAVFGALVGQTFFNLPFWLMPPKKRQLTLLNHMGVPVLIFALGFVVLSARFIIMITGTYWHNNPAEFMFTPVFSPLAIFDTVGGIVTVYAAFRVIRAKKLSDESLAKIYLFLEITWHFFSGKREGLFLAILCIIMALIFIQKKVQLRYVAVFAVLVLFIGAYLGLYRDYGAERSVGATVYVKKAMRYAFKEQQKRGLKLVMNMALDRLNDGQFAAGCFMNVPDNYPFLEGGTYKMILWIPIPRVVYPPRPQFIVNYYGLFQPWVTWSSAPVTTVGEAYINFGWLGIPLVFLALGCIYRAMDSVFRPRLSYAEAAILIFYSTLLIRMMVNPAVSHLSWMLKILLLLAVARILAHITVKFDLGSFLRSYFYHPFGKGRFAANTLHVEES